MAVVRDMSVVPGKAVAHSLVENSHLAEDSLAEDNLLAGNSLLAAAGQCSSVKTVW